MEKDFLFKTCIGCQGLVKHQQYLMWRVLVSLLLAYLKGPILSIQI